MKIALLYITHSTQSEAIRIIEPLITDKWIACANYFPVSASYWWEGKIESEDEFVSLIKTHPQNVNKIKKRIEETHPYEVPCIIHWEVEANPKYAHWIYNSVISLAE